MPRGVYERKIRPLRERLLARLQKRPSGCWEWPGSRTEFGHGEIMLDHQSKRRIPTHRASWLIHKGPIRDGLFVLHACDNPACCNPAHLFLGTKQDNTDAMRAKGRMKVGAALPQAKLTIRSVIAIRQSGLSRAALAEKYGVSKGTIYAVRTGRRWRHI